MSWIEYNFEVAPLKPGAEILVAELSLLGFESFADTPTGLLAYSREQVNEAEMQAAPIFSNEAFTISWQVREIEEENWNATWEDSFDPINVNGRVSVRASFHAKPEGVEYDILIDPKMSFGTGHHETTWMILEHLLDMDVAGKAVLDMGCGTGVLAILTHMKGAGPILAIDNDSWAYENAVENARNNNAAQIDVRHGDASLLEDKQFDVILANINLNVLLHDLPVYADVLAPQGVILMSGFYLSDLDALKERAAHTGLDFEMHTTRNNWAMGRFVKNN